MENCHTINNYLFDYDDNVINLYSYFSETYFLRLQFNLCKVERTGKIQVRIIQIITAFFKYLFYSCSIVLQIMGKYIRGNHSCQNVFLMYFRVCSILLPILWGVLCSIMILRIFLGVDFTLVNVVLSAYKPVESAITEDDWSDTKLGRSEEHSRFPISDNTLDLNETSGESSKLPINVKHK